MHLAAQAGVRYSLENPRAYVDSNLTGSFNLLEVAKATKPKHLLLASTSSVYGGNETMPFRESDRADFPITLYAATKKAMEAMAHSYAHLWDLPTTCFRFFTVYGPWGRPDMALFKFVEAIQAGRPIEIYGMGKMRRDFTFIDDLVEAITRLLDRSPAIGEPVTFEGGADTLSPVAPWRVVNIAGGQPRPAARIRRGDRGGAWSASGEDPVADAAWRRARDLRRPSPARSADRLSPANAAFGRRACLRRVVSVTVIWAAEPMRSLASNRLTALSRGFQ